MGEPLWTAPKQTVLIPWRTWTAEEISMHLRSPAMEKELKQGVPPIIQATDLANELENRDVDGQALDKLLEGQGANLCRNLEALALGKNRGRRCVELVSAVRRSFGEGGDPEVKTESRWRWYWPFSATSRTMRSGFLVPSPLSHSCWTNGIPSS